MIYPTSAQLLSGLAESLRETVLPELARGTDARRQLQAALEILHHLVFAAPNEAAALAADNMDMAEVLARAAAMIELYPDRLPPLNLPHRGGGTRLDSEAPPLDGGGLGGGDAATEPAYRSLALQAELADVQSKLPTLPPDLRGQISTLLVDLHKRMTDRALVLIPPPRPRP